MGKATAREAVEAGVYVVIAGRDEEELKDAQSLIGGRVETYVLNVRDARETGFFFEEMGRFDHLVVTAAEAFHADFIDCDVDEARKAFETKFWGPFTAVQMAVPYISEQGSITLFSGAAGSRVFRGSIVLGAANCAVESLVRSLAIELSPLRINAVAPGDVASDESDVNERGRLGARIPLGRAGSTSDVARAVLFLLDNPFVTGSVLRIDGGVTAL